MRHAANPNIAMVGRVGAQHRAYLRNRGRMDVSQYSRYIRMRADMQTEPWIIYLTMSPLVSVLAMTSLL